MRFVGIKDLPIDSLESYPGNARVHNETALDQSAEVNGQYRSIVARVLPDEKVQILAGHGTRDAFRRRGEATVRVELIEADDSEALRINLADNGTSRLASYDDRLLAELLATAEDDKGFAGTGWDDDAYQALVNTLRLEGAEFRDLMDQQATKGAEKSSPDEFVSYDDETIAIDHECPRCGYQWSGKSE